MNREQFMEIVYSELHSDGDNNRANRIIDAADEYAGPRTGRWVPVGVAEVVGGESAMWGSAIAYHKCSECNGEALEEGGKEKLSGFCPNCGAKMEVTNGN